MGEFPIIIRRVMTSHSTNVVDLNFMKKWCRLHDTAAHFEINFLEMEKVVKIAQEDTPSYQGKYKKGVGSIDIAMDYELFDEESPFPRQEENELEEDVYDALAFQTKGSHFLRN